MLNPPRVGRSQRKLLHLKKLVESVQCLLMNKVTYVDGDKGVSQYEGS